MCVSIFLYLEFYDTENGALKSSSYTQYNWVTEIKAKRNLHMK